MELKEGHLCLTKDESKMSGVASPMPVDKFNESLQRRQDTVKAQIAEAEEIIYSDHNECGMQERGMAKATLESLQTRGRLLEDIAAFVLSQEVEPL